MKPNSYYLIFFIINGALSLEGFNFTSPYEIEGEIHRDGKFLFDALFGLEADDDVATNTATNTLKSCDCGKFSIHQITNFRFGNILHFMTLTSSTRFRRKFSPLNTSIFSTFITSLNHHHNH
jgi:hypothetical protein